MSRPRQKQATGRGRLPVLPSDRPPLARSRSTRWRVAALVGVHLLVALHIAHWRVTGRTMSPLEPSEAMELAKYGVVNAGAAFFAATILLTAIFGRFFCGWACHLVALQDLSRSILEKVGVRPKPFRSRVLRWVPAVAFGYMFVWPAAVRAGLGEAFPGITLELAREGFWETFPGWAVALVTFAVCGFAAIYLLGAKGFCTYGCPYGAAFGAVDRLAPLSIRVTDACRGCAHCTATCTSNVRVHEEVAAYGMVVDSGCMKTLDCVSVCPNDALYLGWGRPAILARPRDGRSRPKRRWDLGWTDEALAAGVFAASFVVFRGLYGWFPFLLTLGLSACLAWLAWTAERLATRPTVTLRGWTLRRLGRLERPGLVFLGVAALLGLFWLHSAGVRLESWRGERAFAATAAARERVEEAAAPVELEAAERTAVEAARRSLGRAERWSLVADPSLKARLATLALLSGDEEEFARRGREALAAAPGNAGLRVALANFEVRRGRPAAAAELYAEALAIDSGLFGAALELGLIRAGSGDLAGAAQAFDRGLAVAAADPRLLYNRALVDLARGDAAPAIERLRRALVADPEYLEARENLAGALCAVGRFEEGIAQFSEALRLSPDDPVTRLLLARALIAVGDLDAAQKEIARARALDPGRPEIAIVSRELVRARDAGS